MSPRTRRFPADRDMAAESIPTLREPRYSQSLERGLAILRCFTASRPVLGISDIADELDMSRSTTHRYVITLHALGYLEQLASRKYRLGLNVTTLGMSALASTGLQDHAHPYLEDLAQHAAATVSLGVLDGPEVLYLDQAHSYRRRGRTRHARTGARASVHCNAMGKLLLANLPEPEQRALLATIKLERHGPNTIKNKQALREALQDIRDTNVAPDDEEMAERVLAIAAPVRNAARAVIAAIEITIPSGAISLSDLEKTLGPHLLATADRISVRLGYRRRQASHG